MVKKAMAITMLDAVEVAAKEFEESHLFTKLRKMLVVARVDDDKSQTESLLHGIFEFDMDDSDIYSQLKLDYDEIRDIIRNRRVSSLTSATGKLIQPRTKGAGHGTTSRAFYARKVLVRHIVGLGTI